MKTSNSPVAATIIYYDKLLQRYARRFIRDTATIEQLVQQVLEDQYEIDRLAPSVNLRKALKIGLFNRCCYRKQSLIFDRAPVYPFKYAGKDNSQHS